MAVKYEFVFLTKPDAKKDELKETFSELEKQIKSIDGKIKDKEEVGRKDLAYQIKGQDQAQFWVWQLDFPEKSKFNPLNTYLNRSDAVIRYLLLLKSK